jgi:hypothetical protein
MALKSPVAKNPAMSATDKIGRVVFASMVTCIVTYHGLDSLRKLYGMGNEVNAKISAYFDKKKAEVEAEKAASIK